MPLFKRASAVALVVAAGLLNSGRAAADEELATVSGTVTLDGAPLAGARVIFHVGDGQFVGGKTDDYGKYKVARVPVGTHKVTVEVIAGGKVKVPARYASEDHSALRVNVKKGASAINLDVESK